MQFSVPQFVEVEDKIIGPLTLKQFFVLLGGAFIIFLLFRLVTNLFFFILLTIPIGGASVVLAFGRFNGRPIISIVLSAMHFVSESRSFVYIKEGQTDKSSAEEKVVEEKTTQIADEEQMERLNRLKKLSYILDQDVKSERELIDEKFTNLKR